MPDLNFDGIITTLRLNMGDKETKGSKRNLTAHETVTTANRKNSLQRQSSLDTTLDEVKQLKSSIPIDHSPRRLTNSPRLTKKILAVPLTLAVDTASSSSRQSSPSHSHKRLSIVNETGPVPRVRRTAVGSSEKEATSPGGKGKKDSQRRVSVAPAVTYFDADASSGTGFTPPVERKRKESRSGMAFSEWKESQRGNMATSVEWKKMLKRRATSVDLYVTVS